MTEAMLEGVGLTVVAGAMAGNCMLPMKFAQRWSWEHVWLIFSIVSLLVLPWTLALVLVQRLLEVYRTVPAGVMLLPLLLGAGWGIAQILFGISVRRLGVGLAYAIIIGLGAALGTLVPLLLGQRHFATTEALVLILGGVLVMLVGIALTGWAGRIRERADGAALAGGTRAEWVRSRARPCRPLRPDGPDAELCVRFWAGARN